MRSMWNGRNNMVKVEVKDKQVHAAEVRVGEQVFHLAMMKPLPISRIDELEEMERKLNELSGQTPVTPLRQLRSACSEYERLFLRELATKGEVNVAHVLAAYKAAGLKSGTGRILAGVTGGVRKKLPWYKVEDLYTADYDGDERIWILNSKYTSEAREAFEDS